MQTAPVLRLNRQQAEQLAAYFPDYRAYVWHSVPPSRDRNQTLRTIQGFHARLLCFQEQREADITLTVTTAEGRALRQMFTTLLALYGTESPSPQRTRLLGELAALRLLVERSLHPTGE